MAPLIALAGLLVGRPQEYTVPFGTIVWGNEFIGVKFTLPPLQIVKDCAGITGVGFIVTVSVNG